MITDPSTLLQLGWEGHDGGREGGGSQNQKFKRASQWCYTQPGNFIGVSQKCTLTKNVMGVSQRVRSNWKFLEGVTWHLAVVYPSLLQ